MSISTGQVLITFDYSRHIGPRFVQAGVTLSFDASHPYSFSSRAAWPPEYSPSERYLAAVRATVEEVLQARLGSLANVRVVLESVSLHPVDSSLNALRTATRYATEAAFAV